MKNQNSNKEFIEPQQFGAVGNGIADDTAALEQAIAEATEKKIALKLPKGEYKILRTLKFENIDVYCEDAKISFYGLEKNAPAVDVWDYVNVYGKLHIWSIDNEINNHGGRCAMGFGEYGSGRGAHDCYVEDVTVSGGVPNANGVFVTGDSHNITLDKVTVPKGTKICRGILVHWGNAGNYQLDLNNPAKGIQVVENSKVTKHPHDIHVGTLICSDIDAEAKYGDAAAFFVSGSYNITVNEIIADTVRTAFTVVGGDCGFLYAPAEIQEHGMKNLKVGKIKATNVMTWGLYFCGNGVFYRDRIFRGELEFGEVDITYSSSYNGTGTMFFGIQKLRAKSITLRNVHSQAMLFTVQSNDVEIDELNLLDGCRGEAVCVRQWKEEGPNQNIHIKQINIGCGCGDASKHAIRASYVNGLQIDSLKLDPASYQGVLSIGEEIRDIKIGQIESNSVNGSATTDA